MRASSHPGLVSLVSALALVLSLAASFGACARKSVGPEPEPPGRSEVGSGTNPSPLALSDLGLSSEEAAWVEGRRAAGKKLVAAIMDYPDSYRKLPDGTIVGFDYDFLLEFCRVLELDLEPVFTSFDGFFEKDGAVPADLGPNAAYDYTPDLLKRVDLYAGSFANVPWRERLMRMVPIYPRKNQLASLEDHKIGSIKELAGKRFATFKDSAQHKELLAFSEREGLGLTFVFGKDDADCFDLVRAGEAEYVLNGSLVYAKNRASMSDFVLSFYPAEIQSSTWCLAKDNAALAGILSKFVIASQKHGIFSELWERTFKMDFEAYFQALMTTDGAEKAPSP